MNDKKNASICLATLFLTNDTKKTLAQLGKILKNFSVTSHTDSGNCFNEVSLSGVEYADIHEKLINPLIAILDEDKQSSIYFRDSDGGMATFLITDGELMSA